MRAVEAAAVAAGQPDATSFASEAEAAAAPAPVMALPHQQRSSWTRNRTSGVCQQVAERTEKKKKRKS